MEEVKKTHIVDQQAAYRRMAQDEEREAEALEWIEGTMGGITAEALGSVVGKLRAVGRRRDSKAKTGHNHQQ